MKNEKYILDIIFATRFSREYKLADLKPLISFEPTWKYQFGYSRKMLCFHKRRGYVIPEDVRAGT
jgi:MoxR-like ATPase